MYVFHIEKYSRQKVVELESSQAREMDDNLNCEIFNEVLKDNRGRDEISRERVVGIVSVSDKTTDKVETFLIALVFSTPGELIIASTINFQPFHCLSPSSGRCKCNGHASTCARKQDSGEHYCECDHNTAGKDCQRCLPLFNDRPWRRASGRSANPCKGMPLFLGLYVCFSYDVCCLRVAIVIPIKRFDKGVLLYCNWYAIIIFPPQVFVRFQRYGKGGFEHKFKQ